MWKQAKLSITQKDLVARLQVLGLKVAQSTISKIEQGTRQVFGFEVVALAKALKVSTSWLIEEASKQNILR